MSQFMITQCLELKVVKIELTFSVVELSMLRLCSRVFHIHFSFSLESLLLQIVH